MLPTRSNTLVALMPALSLAREAMAGLELTAQSDCLAEAVKPVLKQRGLRLLTTGMIGLKGGVPMVQVAVMHNESGEWLAASSEVEAPNGGVPYSEWQARVAIAAAKEANRLTASLLCLPQQSAATDKANAVFISALKRIWTIRQMATLSLAVRWVEKEAIHQLDKWQMAQLRTALDIRGEAIGRKEGMAV